MRLHVVDPSAFTTPYDHALCTAVAAEGLDVELITSRFAYGAPPSPEGYARRELFYRWMPGAAGSATRRMAKLAQHVPDMLRYRRLTSPRGRWSSTPPGRSLPTMEANRPGAGADVVHFQWLDVPWLDGLLLPRRPLVLTAHDLLPREPRPGQAWAQRRLYDRVDAVIAHSAFGAAALRDQLDLPPQKVHVIHHGAFTHLASQPDEQPLPPDLAQVEGPVVLCFGLIRPYKGIDVLLQAWRALQAAQPGGVVGAELWIVGRPRMALEPLRALAPPGVRFVPRFVSDPELPAYFRRAELVVLPYTETRRFDQSGVLATALAFAKPLLLTAVGGFPEVAQTGAARLVPPQNSAALHEAIAGLLADSPARERMAAAARLAAEGPYSWQQAARQTVELYRQIAR